MDIKGLRQRLSLRNISQSLLRVVQRFPIASFFLICLTLHCSSLSIMDREPEEVEQCLMMFMSIGFLISLSVSLWGEEQTGKRRRWIVEGLCLALWGIYCVALFFTDLMPERKLPSFYLGNGAWLAAVILFIPLGSFLREKNDLKTWHFMLSLIGVSIISGVVTWVMIGGLEGLLFGTAALFDFEAGKMFPMLIIFVCSILLFGLMFLAMVPQGERKHNDSAEMPSFLTKIVSWLLIPLLCCYIAVLYVYGFRILICWELPKGMISLLVSVVMGVYLLCYVLLYPKVTDRQSWQSRVLTFWLPVFILPLLVLMTVGVGRRFVDYGITAPRLYLLTLLLWYYAVCIVIIVAPRQRFRWIFLSFGVLFLLSSGHPLNYYRICRPILTAKIDKIIEEKGLQLPLNLYSLSDNPALTKEEADELYTDFHYMRTSYGYKYTDEWLYIDSEEKTAEDKDEPVEMWHIWYSNSSDEYLCPRGYSRYKRIREGSVYYPIELTDDSIYNGFVHVGYQDVVLLFDTAAINRANNNDKDIIILSADGKAAYVPDEIDIRMYSDHTLKIYYRGFIFTNR